MTEFEFPDWLKVGASFIDHTSPNMQIVWHVRGFVDNRAVIRTWQNRQQCWRYMLETAYWFHIRRDALILRKAGEDPSWVRPLEELYSELSLVHRNPQFSDGMRIERINAAWKALCELNEEIEKNE